MAGEPQDPMGSGPSSSRAPASAHGNGSNLLAAPSNRLLPGGHTTQGRGPQQVGCMRAGVAAVDTDVLVHLSSVFPSPSKPVLGPVLCEAQGLHPGWGLITSKGQGGLFPEGNEPG